MQDASPPYLASNVSKGLNSGVLGLNLGVFEKIAPDLGVQNFRQFSDTTVEMVTLIPKAGPKRPIRVLLSHSEPIKLLMPCMFRSFWV